MDWAVGWTPERRKRQAELIRGWTSWVKSTGPKSPEGKAAVSRNAFTGGEVAKLREMVKQLKQAMRAQKDWLD